mmetsp:Transcript_61464/g.194551  ORF Transcript_61464/g.194551 Transcript_61464/m.194551 type:complete len:376 (-) Transcript_61464:56-1183(-)
MRTTPLLVAALCACVSIASGDGYIGITSNSTTSKASGAGAGRGRRLQQSTLDQRLIGWMGESFNQHEVFGTQEGEFASSSAGPRPSIRGAYPKSNPEKKEPWVEVLSWKPRAWLAHNFLTDEETDHLIALATPKMKRSTVVDAVTGDSILDNIRTSSGCFLRRQQDDIVWRIEDKVARLTMLPIENQEDIQVLQYEVGQKYDAHWDYFDDPVKHRAYLNGGQRVATVLLYLNTPDDGGETVFPHSKWIDEDTQKQGEYSKCGQRGVAAHAKKGDALLFWSMQPDGSEDRHSMHAGCPPTKGIKWTATKWIHAGPFQVANLLPSAHGKCMDLNENCVNWAGSGECEKNKPFMLGDEDAEGQCRLSCKACTPGPPPA